MIFDSLENFILYEGLSSAFPDVLRFIASTDLVTLAVGRHPINDHGSYASVNEYATKTADESFIECHNRYIDIQIIAYGEEKIGVAGRKQCVEQPYDEAKDLVKLDGMVDCITLLPGFFVVFFPHDAHEPGMRSGTKPVNVKKIVFKIPVVTMTSSVPATTKTPEAQ